MSKGGAKQSFAREANINEIMKKYHKTGALPVVTEKGFYGDFSNGLDFQESMNKVIKVRNAFMAIDPRIRSQFDNDPVKFIDYINNPKNHPEAVKLGLLDKAVLPKEDPKPVELTIEQRAQKELLDAKVAEIKAREAKK